MMTPQPVPGGTSYVPPEPPQPGSGLEFLYLHCCESSERPEGAEDFNVDVRKQILLAQLQQEVQVPFVPGREEHEAFLLAYFQAAAPAMAPASSSSSTVHTEKPPTSSKDARWKLLGFQSEDPRTDFRGGGLMSLRCMLFMADINAPRFCKMIRESAGMSGEKSGKKGDNYYPFSAAVINMCFELAGWLMLDPRRHVQGVKSGKICNGCEYRRFAGFLEAEPESFLILTASAVAAMHEDWCEERYSIMEFHQAIQRARDRVAAFLQQSSEEDMRDQIMFALRETWFLPRLQRK
eukprot:TRINITY_DN52541_c0_g1_i1.p1 TRINITY_DN52541_c0_g1~~TRINITY_DN52541_c0_g1_i1.p1  ORF type:complete len:306 (+),score=73.28 TRINITY_DN52541_c0_g1_i1:41-919(+)